jgi:hypothetical protein
MNDRSILMTSADRYEEQRAALEHEGIPVRPMSAFWLARLVGKLGAEGFTFGAKVYLARPFERTTVGYGLLLHEAVHARDQRRFGLLFYVTYALLPLPVFLSFRAVWEWRAYRETLRAELESYGRISDETVEGIARQFSSRLYWWMLPIPAFTRWLVRRERRRLETREG